MPKRCPFEHKQCIENQCTLFVHLIGKNPQSEAMVDEWNCVFAWLPILLTENSQMQVQTKAAIESFRNTVMDNPFVKLLELKSIEKLSELPS